MGSSNSVAVGSVVGVLVGRWVRAGRGAFVDDSSRMTGVGSEPQPASASASDAQRNARLIMAGGLAATLKSLLLACEPAITEF